MRLAAVPVADDRGALRREVIAASANLASGYMIVWTAVTLAVVLRGLGRVRAARLRLMRGR